MLNSMSQFLYFIPVILDFGFAVRFVSFARKILPNMEMRACELSRIIRRFKNASSPTFTYILCFSVFSPPRSTPVYPEFVTITRYLKMELQIREWKRKSFFFFFFHLPCHLGVKVRNDRV
jgi:hypothetical protein